MPSYEPVDLSAACNAGVEVLGDEPGDVPLGRVDLRGLPFLIGPEPPSAERCFLLPGAPMSVGIGRVARRVIVAHRLLEPGAPAGHAVGQTVAEYVFHLSGGEVVVAPIRERFEIQVVPPEWGRLPFLAVTDTSDHNLPRFEGNWGEAGARLVEHAMGWPAGYYLWCWENPHPERPVERIEFIPRGGRDSSSPASPPATLTSTRSSARRRARCGSWPRTGETASSMSTWTGVWRPIRSRCPARTTGPAGERPKERPRMRRSPRCRRPPSRSGGAATSSAGCAGATWNVTGGPTPARSRSSWPKAAVTGCTSASSTTRPGGRCRAGSISVRPQGFPTSRTATTTTSRRISTAGITTSAVTSGWASAPTRTSTAPARDGCHEATSWWT